MNFKRANVLLIPTEKATCLFSNNDRLANYHKPQLGDGKDVVNYELYIISDDEIKELDYYLHPNMQTISQHGVNDKLTGYEEIKASKKIIATTNSSLKYNTEIGRKERQFGDGELESINFELPLPQPSQSFIEVFVREYNKGNIITDVMVEYEQMSQDEKRKQADGINSYSINKLKINPKNNTINIKLIKDSWSRDEVYNLMEEAWIRGEADKSMDYTVREKWIQENL